MARLARSVTVILAVALGATLALAGCGSLAPLPPGPKVTLSVTAPTDESRVSADQTTVMGVVTPARARVEVLGRRVTVAPDGSFAAQVGLTVGMNLIDVIASAPRSPGAVAAVRVTRFLLVTVPQVSGESPKQAAAALKALGLTVQTDSSSNPLNFLIPASVRVCSTSPSAGKRVDPGSTVTLQTSKLCGL